MKYSIYCKETHKHLATYYNAETLKTLDTDKCYYIANILVAHNDPLVQKTTSRTVASRDRTSISKRSVSENSKSDSSSNTQNDYMNPLNPVGYYAQAAHVSDTQSCHNSSYSASSHSYSSSYSDHSSSSSSCDSSSYSSDSSGSSSF